MNTKEKIVTTVVEMLKQNVKYEDISMALVAEKVGIGKSTIYEYFNSKSELLLYCTEKLVDQLVHDLFDFDLNQYTFHDALIKQLQCFLKYNISPYYAVPFITENKTLFTDEFDKVEEFLIELQNKISGRFSLIFKKGIEENIIKHIDNKYVFYVLNSIIFSSVAIHTYLKENEKAEFFETVFEVIVKVLN